MKEWYSAGDLVGVPGIAKDGGAAKSKVTVIARLKELRAEFRSREARGGGLEYNIRSLPAETQRALILRAPPATPALPAPAESVAALPAPSAERGATQLADWQRDCMAARVALVREVQRLAAVLGTERAVQQVVEMAATGALPEPLAAALRLALAKKHPGAVLSRSTLYRWGSDFASQGEIALAPKAPARGDPIPAWAPYLLAEYQQPQKPALTEALARLRLPDGVPAPSYDQARRLLTRMSVIERNKGRMGANELKSLKAFRRRDTSRLWPCDLYTSDGHTFKAEVAHPEHGGPFRPEITPVLDVATRRCVGWSASLAESALSVLDAFCRAVEHGGVPAIFYVDNGSGFKNQMLGHEATGVFARIGTELTHALPYNSQARGIIERFHRSVWVSLAKTLPTYLGKDMDRQAKQLAHKVTRAEIKRVGRSALLPRWWDFLRLCEQAIAAYNNAPHRSLPKVRAADGKLRHQSPNEAWASAIAEGWDPAEAAVPPALVSDLYRPCEVRKATRGEVTLWGNRYFSKALEDWSEFVRVHYDVHDASRVWVRDRNGALICVAGFEGNKSGYLPVSRIEHARDRREKGRAKRLEQHLEEVRLERGERPALPGHVITDEDARIAAEELARLQAQVAERAAVAQREAARGAAALAELAQPTSLHPVQEPAAPVVRPTFRDDFVMWCWVQEHPEHATPEDHLWLEAALRDDSDLRLQVDAWLARHAGKKKPAG